MITIKARLHQRGKHMSFHIDPVLQNIYKLNDHQVGLISSYSAYDIDIDEEWMLSLPDVLENDDYDIYSAFLNSDGDESMPDYFSISSLYEIVFYVNFGLATLEDFLYLTQDSMSYDDADDMIFLYDHHQFDNLDDDFCPGESFLTPRQFYDYYVENGLHFGDAIDAMNEEDTQVVSSTSYEILDMSPEELVKSLVRQVIDRNDINQRILHNGDETLVITNGNEGTIFNLPLPSSLEKNKSIQEESEIRFLEKMFHDEDLADCIQDKIDDCLIHRHRDYFMENSDPRFTTPIDYNPKISGLLKDVSQRNNPRCKIGVTMYDHVLQEHVEYASDVCVKDGRALWSNPEVAVLLMYDEIFNSITHGRVHIIFHPDKSQVSIEENGDTTTTLHVGMWHYHEGMFEGITEENRSVFSHGLIPAYTSMYKEIFEFIDTEDFSCS